jgi:hypothetical protein
LVSMNSAHAWDPFAFLNPVSCNLEKCSDAKVVQACNDAYLGGDIRGPDWSNCMMMAVYSGALKGSDLVSMSIADGVMCGCNLDYAVYDVSPKDCIMEKTELDAVLARLYAAGQLSDPAQYQALGGYTCIKCVAVSYPSSPIMGCSLSPVTTIPSVPVCSSFCKNWANDCATSRDCVYMNCEHYTQTRVVDYCTCLNTCGNNKCSCNENHASCASDCTTTTTRPGLCSNGQKYQSQIVDCVMPSGCPGQKKMECYSGIWGEYGSCSSVNYVCGDGSCSINLVCPNTSTTTLAPGQTATTHPGASTTIPFCLDCYEPNFWDQFIGFFSGIGEWILGLFGG